MRGSLADKPVAVMSISTQRRFGLVLACISVLAFIVVQILFADAHVIESGSHGSGRWVANWTAVGVKLDSSWRSWIPALGGGIGVLCFAWPSRKPPKLPVRQ
jgi:hypothetical protein